MSAVRFYPPAIPPFFPGGALFRPTSATALAVLNWLGGTIAVVAGLVAFWGSLFVTSLLPQISIIILGIVAIGAVVIGLIEIGSGFAWISGARGGYAFVVFSAVLGIIWSGLTIVTVLILIFIQISSILADLLIATSLITLLIWAIVFGLLTSVIGAVMLSRPAVRIFFRRPPRSPIFRPPPYRF